MQHRVVPIMISNIGAYTYLFFAVINASFLPFIYIFFPETAHRSLEEIDIIFAKGSVEKMSYVKAAAELPFLSEAEVESEALRYGLIDVVERVHHGGDAEAQKGDLRQRKSAGADSEKVFEERHQSGSDVEEVAVEKAAQNKDE